MRGQVLKVKQVLEKRLVLVRGQVLKVEQFLEK